jgi:hypothetical protein
MKDRIIRLLRDVILATKEGRQTIPIELELLAAITAPSDGDNRSEKSTIDRLLKACDRLRSEMPTDRRWGSAETEFVNAVDGLGRVA